MIPKIIAVSAKQDLLLVVNFSDGFVREYDCKNILYRNEHYTKLHDENFFKSFHIDTGGHGISWDDYVDISEYEIIQNARQTYKME